MFKRIKNIIRMERKYSKEDYNDYFAEYEEDKRRLERERQYLLSQLTEQRRKKSCFKYFCCCL